MWMTAKKYYRFTVYVIIILTIALVSVGCGPELKRQAEAGGRKLPFTADNPCSKTFPTLGVWQGQYGILVSAAFPNVPDFTCDCWCYESEVDFVGARPLDGGRVELRHRSRKNPDVIVVTTVTPEAGAMEISARMELAKEGVGSLPEEGVWLNTCWQLGRAAGFCSAPDPYPEFVKRCFIFTEKGRTFLDKTVRKKIPCRSADDPKNNPPWVQSYVGVWQKIPETRAGAWADHSTDRYVRTVIGGVSRDGKYLAALANDSAQGMAQAWHDCMHNNPQWLPADAPPAEKRWRQKIYVMENDPDALLQRVAKDFPNAGKRAKNWVSPK